MVGSVLLLISGFTVGCEETGGEYSEVDQALDDDVKIVATLDTEYQSAVERNDWQDMDRILHPDFVLILGDGTIYSRSQLIASAKDRYIEYEEQAEVPETQIVRLYGDNTATVTAQLVLKGTRKEDRSKIDFKLWFTDTYVRTKDGWRYAFGQAGTPLKPTP